MKGLPDISKLSAKDRRELRNFARFTKLWPIYGFDMIQRPAWQRYLNLTPAEAKQMAAKPIAIVEAIRRAPR